jgi:phosphohistidine phosphatase
MSRKSSRSLPGPIPQACAVPYRVRRGKLEFCLITSTGKGHWAFPKGIVDPGETPAETALKEAHEEAGLLGEIEGKPLGKYTYAKWGNKLEVTAFLMRVSRTETAWQEADVRQRRWCGVKEAQERIVRQELQELLESALTRLAQLSKSEPHSKTQVAR